MQQRCRSGSGSSSYDVNSGGRKQTWPQRIGADAGQISRYENGHMTPSAEAVAKLAEVLDVSADYLFIDSGTRRSLRSPENVLGDHLALTSPSWARTSSPSCAASSTD